jgi:murein DD-endopeptidase MepM/ murein hydrolase activator NlpD
LHTHHPHLGVDYAAPIGTPVLSTGDGVVTEAGYEKSSGKYLKIRHNSVYTTMYLHLSKFANETVRGTSVKQGQVIGYVGSSGLSTGPHLDYRFFINGKPVDPLKVELPPSHPVDKELRDEFDITKNEIIRLLRISDSQFVFETEPYVLRKSSLK